MSSSGPTSWGWYIETSRKSLGLRGGIGNFTTFPYPTNIWGNFGGTGRQTKGPVFMNGQGNVEVIYTAGIAPTAIVNELDTITNAKLSSTATAHTSNSFGYPGASPGVSANGASNGIVWAVENSSPAVLHAYDAATLNELYNINQASAARDQFGNGNKFITPTIVNGKVFVGTPNGVAVFGLLP